MSHCKRPTSRFGRKLVDDTTTEIGACEGSAFGRLAIKIPGVVEDHSTARVRAVEAIVESVKTRFSPASVLGRTQFEYSSAALFAAAISVLYNAALNRGAVQIAGGV